MIEFLFIILLSTGTGQSDVLAYGDSLYLSGDIEAAFDYFSRIPVSTDDTVFNDVRRRLQYLEKVMGLDIWTDSILLIDRSEIHVSNILCDEFLEKDIPSDVEEILYLKKAEIMILLEDSVSSYKYFILAGSADNLLKAAEIAYNQNKQTAYQIFERIIYEYPYSVEADIAREYIERK